MGRRYDEFWTFLFGVFRDGGVSMYSLMHWRFLFLFLFSLCFSKKKFPFILLGKSELHDESIGTLLAELT